MLVWLEQFLVRYPELALFLVIAVGYWIASFKVSVTADPHSDRGCRRRILPCSRGGDGRRHAKCQASR